LFGQVAIDKAFVDWSGNCGNLSGAVGPFAITSGLIDPARLPRDGVATVRIWQANIGKTIETLIMSYGQKYDGWPKQSSRFLFEMGLLQ
jgi:2-methylaconitate cis-trans-isomerase PrpF